MTILKLFAIFLAAYLIGNFSPAYLIGKIVGKFDIREKGSGNAGTTNVIRLLGWRYGALVFFLDSVKGLAAVGLGFWLGAELGVVSAAFGVVIGHDFPVLLNFHGGKGIASTTGIFLFLFPVPTLVAILVFVAVVLATRMVSAGSLVFVVCMTGYMLISHQSLVLLILGAGLTIFAFVRHIENIRRILHGKENKLSLGEKR
jgi:glycerol-3-phosphate acyltransferase PlsY